MSIGDGRATPTGQSDLGRTGASTHNRAVVTRHGHQLVVDDAVEPRLLERADRDERQRIRDGRPHQRNRRRIQFDGNIVQHKQPRAHQFRRHYIKLRRRRRRWRRLNERQRLSAAEPRISRRSRLTSNEQHIATHLSGVNRTDTFFYSLSLCLSM